MSALDVATTAGLIVSAGFCGYILGWVRGQSQQPPTVVDSQIDLVVREYAYQKALGYKDRKLNRTRVYTTRLENALRKQKAQTADDQRYIDAMEKALGSAAVAFVRADFARAGGAEGDTDEAAG